jgi:hypothetical protein
VTTAPAPPRRTLDIGVDLDGVCYPFDRVLARFVAATTGRDLALMPTPASWDIPACWGLSAAEFGAHVEAGIAAGVIFRRGGPFVGVVAGMQRLAEAGHRLHIVTDRARGELADVAAASTRAWLADYHIPYTSLTLSGDKTQVDVDAFIEDRDVNFLALAEAGSNPYLRHQPWNAHLEVAASRRVSDFGAFVGQVEALAAA